MKIPRPRAQRIVQVISASVYLILLLHVVIYRSPAHSDLYLRIDPLIVAGTTLAIKTIKPKLVLGMLLLFLPFVLGRVFCGWICPMGIVIDIVDSTFRGKKRFRNHSKHSFENWKRVKYMLLFFFLGSAAAGITVYFYLSPISLINRFFITFVYPALAVITSTLLDILRPLAKITGLGSLVYATVKTPTYNTNFFVFAMVSIILAFACLKPRFWCRYLCPSGALLGILSHSPIIRRTVTREECTECGLCRQNCPMNAIEKEPYDTNHSECLTCLKCSKICPENAIKFKTRFKKSKAPHVIVKERRTLLFWSAGGLLAAFLFYANPSHPSGVSKSKTNRHSRLLRPPGAVPEKDFLKLCSRCYECIAACPTNTLQPIWFSAGLEAIWTPKVTTSRAPCDKNCSLCGQVCPTGAIRALTITDKMYCKIGTARIYKNRCLAWEQDRKCLVCDEVCPYNAVKFIAVRGRKNRVPVVEPNKCSGCGYCETHCPVDGEKAIIVEIFGEVRIKEGSYKEESAKRGLSLELRKTLLKKESGDAELPPGFDFSK